MIGSRSEVGEVRRVEREGVSGTGEEPASLADVAVFSSLFFFDVSRWSFALPEFDCADALRFRSERFAFGLALPVPDASPKAMTFVASTLLLSDALRFLPDGAALEPVPVNGWRFSFSGKERTPFSEGRVVVRTAAADAERPSGRSVRGFVAAVERVVEEADFVGACVGTSWKTVKARVDMV